MIRYEIVATYMVHDMCECGGEFVPNGDVMPVEGGAPIYVHVCSVCGSKVTHVGRQYPYIDYGPFPGPMSVLRAAKEVESQILTEGDK